MAVTDLLLALPSLPLYLLVLTLVRVNQGTLILTLGLLSWPAYAKVVRGVVIETRTAPYVDAARALGATQSHLARRHLLPATLPILPTKLILSARFAVFAEATLAFLGLGIDGAVSWGTTLSWAFADPLLFARPVWPWLVLPPVLAIATLVLATVWVSEGIASVSVGARQAVPGVRRRRSRSSAGHGMPCHYNPTSNEPAVGAV